MGMKSSGIVVVARGADRRLRFGGLVTLLIYNLYAGSYIYRPRDENPSCLMQLTEAHKDKPAKLFKT